MMVVLAPILLLPNSDTFTRRF